MQLVCMKCQRVDTVMGSTDFLVISLPPRSTGHGWGRSLFLKYSLLEPERAAAYLGCVMAGHCFRSMQFLNWSTCAVNPLGTTAVVVRSSMIAGPVMTLPAN